jgi:hypothetical protein
VGKAEKYRDPQLGKLWVGSSRLLARFGLKNVRSVPLPSEILSNGGITFLGNREAFPSWRDSTKCMIFLHLLEAFSNFAKPVLFKRILKVCKRLQKNL